MATRYHKLLMKFGSSAGFTFAERWVLRIDDLTSLTEARAARRTICTYRAKCLASGWSIIGASVTDSTLPKARIPVDYDYNRIVLDVETDGGVINEVKTCLLYRFQAANGRFVVRGFRAIRDSWVSNQSRLVGADSYDPPTPVNPAWPALAVGAKGALTTPALATTSTAALNALINVLANYTQMYDERGLTAGNGVLRPWTAVYANGVGSHDTGHSITHGGRRRKAKV